VDRFFQSVGRGAERLIDPATDWEQADGVGPHELANAGMVLFALLGTTQGVRQEEAEGRKSRRQA
jgi:hypothetical protein